MLNRWAARADANSKEIDQALLALGWLVHDTSRVGGGFPDRVVQRGGVTRLVEIKVAKGTLRPTQKAFTQLWDVSILRTVDDCRSLQ